MENQNFGDVSSQIEYSPLTNSSTPGNEKYSAEEGGNSALHFFLYLVSFLSLLFVSTGLGAILYQMINKAFPETINGYSYFDSFAQSAVKFGLASIIIATPVFFAISFLINKYLFEGKILENSKVRKWVTYVILFIAASIILGDLISLVYGWLGGDMTSRFILKVLVVLFIAGSIFGYYFWDMRKVNMAGTSYAGNKLAALASLVVIVGIFAASFFIVDSPTETRNKKNDAAIVNELENYTYRIDSYYQKNNTLPANLSDLESERYGRKKENSSIVYEKVGTLTYQLCADFKSSNLKDDNNNDYDYGYADDEWKHDKGNKCFDKKVSQNNRNNMINTLPDVSNSGLMDPIAMEEARVRAQRAQFKSFLASIVPMGIICRDGGGTIASGNSGSIACNGGKNSSETMTWPKISQCGANPEDTSWTVFNGDNDTWTVTLNCLGVNYCNGPGNAICNKDGCTFGGTCQ